ncbi:hypothetical protein BJ912DRAFT_891218 [Pholiota molesta]|nr:hypothetical protein BJ912DRAFT_891218 [Pholiota molesta]
MKDAWKQEIVNFEEQKLRKVSKKEFTLLWSCAYISAFEPDTISAAFRVTGVHPFCREVITEEQMKPSITSSVKGSFPLPQPSPVRAVMSAFNANPPTSFMVSPSTHTLHNQATQIAHGEGEEPPITPTRRRRYAEVDADLFTPSKRMRSLYAGLASTSSGSFLVSKTPLTSATPILDPVLEDLPHLPQPDWSLASKIPFHGQNLEEENRMLRQNLQQAHTLFCAQSGIIEGANATMVVQNMHLRKLNGALYGKENDKVSNRTLIIDASKGQVFSSDEIRNGLSAQEEKKRALDAEKKSKVERRAAKKEAQAKLEDEWKRIKIQHDERVRVWKLTCENLAAEGIAKKNWPKGPIRPRKPKLPANLEVVGDEEDGGDDEEEENIID